MSSAGHVLDMINRMNQNRQLAHDRRRHFSDKSQNHHPNSANIDNTPSKSEKEKPGIWIKAFGLFGLVALIAVSIFFLNILWG